MFCAQQRNGSYAPVSFLPAGYKNHTQKLDESPWAPNHHTDPHRVWFGEIGVCSSHPCHDVGPVRILRVVKNILPGTNMEAKLVLPTAGRARLIAVGLHLRGFAVRPRSWRWSTCFAWRRRTRFGFLGITCPRSRTAGKRCLPRLVPPFSGTNKNKPTHRTARKTHQPLHPDA